MADEPGTDTPPAAPADQGTQQDKTFTQAELDRVVEQRLQRERSKYADYDDVRAKAAELDQLREANASELEKAQGKATKAERERDEARALLLRYEVAQEKEVPAKLVPLLTATDKAGLEAQADLILENAKPGDTPPPDFDGGPREPAPSTKTPEQEHNDLVLGLFGTKPT